MKYQLVFQFSSDAFEDETAVAAFERDLIQILGDDAYVDGIDLGFSETCFFVFSADPAITFERLTPLLERRELLESVTVAHRPKESDHYTVIWPEGWPKEFRIQ